ncbi:MAG: phosphatidate cytidylyltransferase, partial [Bacteroidales bacterium]|nr:phosphatidate cytidylyltransferase [Bacteroidales bacterium]
YAGLLIAGSLWWSPLLYLTLTAFLIIGMVELKKLLKTDIHSILFATWTIISIICLLISVLLFDQNLVSNHFPTSGLSPLLFFSPFLLGFLILIFSTISRKPAQGLLSFFSISIVYLLIPFIFLIGIQNIVFNSSVSWLLVLLAAIWINDSMAYITGSLIGKHKLIERISPGKTWEGFLGGLIFTIATLLIINQIFFDFDAISLAIIALVIVMSGTIGDLLESKLKREAGVKDSGNIMPGHGGILDRIDSLLVAAPFTGIALLINEIIIHWH